MYSQTDALNLINYHKLYLSCKAIGSSFVIKLKQLGLSDSEAAAIFNVMSNEVLWSKIEGKTANDIVKLLNANVPIN